MKQEGYYLFTDPFDPRSGQKWPLARKKDQWRMKYTKALLLVLFVVAIFAPLYAFAAKIRVTWVAPTQNNDGSPLTNLIGYRIEWGSCTANGAFGTFQAGINVAAPATSAWIYPTALNPVCARVYSIASGNVLSAPAYASGPTPYTLSKPTH